MPAVHPTSVAVTPNTSALFGPANTASPTAELARALREAARLDLYATNPFRCLGLFAPAEAADLVGRVQEMLQNTVTPDWAFAPALPLGAEQLRAAGQAADSAAQRLVAELFWFWPEAYPESREDAALAAVAAGDAEKAYGAWLAAGHGSAAHNMAVMFHFAALDRELSKGALDEEARSWWTAAAEQWSAAMAAEDFWARWAARLEAVDTGAPPVKGVELLRSALPRLLATISLVAAAERARRGEMVEARWLHDFAVRRLAAGEAPTEGFELALAAELQRTEEELSQTEERITEDDQPCLAHVAGLLRQMAPRRRTIEAVAGADSELLQRVGARVVEVAQAGLVEHARRAPEDAMVLPWLMHLNGWPVSAEQRRKSNAAVHECWTRQIAAARAADEDLNAHEAVLQICTETLVPAVDEFSWDERAQAAYRQRVVRRLRELAREAWLETGEFEVSAQAYVLAAELLDEESSTLVVRERRQLFQQFQRAQSSALRLEFSGSVLEIDSQRISFGGRVWPVASLSGLRFGVAQSIVGTGPQVAWYSGREAMLLDASTWFDPGNGGAERFRQVVEALDACVVPVLAVRIVARVRDGQSVVFGPSALRPDGFVFQRRPGQLAPENLVPFPQLVQRVEGGDLVLSADGAAEDMRYALATVWNAVAMPVALARLAEVD